MSQSENLDVALVHILVIGFHHQKGTQIEYCYPPIKNPLLDNSDNEDITLPKQWNALPYLAMPDGAHNFEEDTSFFHLPALTKGSKISTDTIFGVACFRQIDSKKLKTKDENVTRTTVQKSVCILMRMPVYNFIASKLQLVTHAYFNQLDFTQTDILQECFDKMSEQFSTIKLDDSIFHMGLNLQDIVLNYKQKILVLFKLLLLEKKVVFWGSPVKDVCNFVISIITLFPGLIHKGLIHSCCVDGIFTQRGAQTPRDPYGLPLAIFEEGSLFQPYMSLHNMTLLRKAKVSSFVVGSSNVLFKQQMHCPWDVLVDLETFNVDIPDPELNKLIDLSTEDLRFCEYLVAVVEASTESTGWEGSDDWLRLQFKAYLLCLLSTVENTLEEDLLEQHQFNGQFCKAWCQSNNFRRWDRTDHPGMENFHKGHPFQGDITISDLRLRINHIAETFANEETRKKIAQALAKTQVVVEEALSSAKSAFTSARGWITGMVQEIEVEMNKHSASKGAVTTANIDISSSNMVLTDRIRKAEDVETIGDIIGTNITLDAHEEEMNTNDNTDLAPPVLKLNEPGESNT